MSKKGAKKATVATAGSRKRVIIMGAAGRDFHNFNTYFRDNTEFEVVCFTAAEQIPGIAGRPYPPELAGKLYPKGIPINAEADLVKIIKEQNIDIVVLAYSDLPHVYVMNKASTILAAGADFMLLGPNKTMIKSNKPVISVCAVRTGSGKSQTTRKIGVILRNMGLKVAVIRHPMPYGDLVKQTCQRFATIQDMKDQECTIEEMEEYEPHIATGNLIFAGVDYGKILEAAEKEADVILWDGGNNDFPFYKSDLEFVVADPYRVGHESAYYPGETNTRRADVLIINKVDSAPKENVEKLKKNLKALNPTAKIIIANSKITVKDEKIVKGKRVLIVEDGPTVTHGDMTTGAGHVAAERLGATIIDPVPYAVGTIKATFEKYSHLKGKGILPAMGYGDHQMKELEETINKADCDAVIIGTPIDLGRLLKINKPSTRVMYDLDEIGSPNVEELIKEFVIKHKLK